MNEDLNKHKLQFVQMKFYLEENLYYKYYYQK